MNDNLQQLSIEQEFKIASFKEWTKTASEEQIKQCLMDTYIQMIHKENLYKAELRKAWGIGNPVP